jgi:transporter family protein
MGKPALRGPILTQRWLVFTLATILLWGVWATLSKFTSATIDPYTTQFYFSAGLLPILVLMWRKGGAGWGHSPRGAFWGFITGILGGLGNMAFFGALSSGGNASVVAPSASLAPLITLLLAVVILRERPTATQWVGLLLSVSALYLLSI